MLDLIESDYIMQAAGRGDQAARLMLPGEAGQPDEEDLPFVAAMLCGQLRLQQPGSDIDVTYGCGRLVLCVHRILQMDGAGHASWHFVVAEAYSWSAGSRRERLRGKVPSRGLHAVYRLSTSDRVMITVQVVESFFSNLIFV